MKVVELNLVERQALARTVIYLREHEPALAKQLEAAIKFKPIAGAEVVTLEDALTELESEAGHEC